MAEKFTTFDLIVAMRGGLPQKCDFCGLPYGDGRYPIPEEAGDWSCNECEAEYTEIIKQQEKERDK